MKDERNRTGHERAWLVGKHSHRHPFLGARRRPRRRIASSPVHSLISDWSKMPPASSSQFAPAIQDVSRPKKLQLLGILSSFAAGAWLGAAEAPTKLVSIGISPMVISLIMVIGVFLARWSLPALILGTSSVRADVRRAPHLVIWALLAGCLWAVANTLTIFAIRDIGLSIAFPLWNSNSLLGILWGFLFFNELRQAV